MSGFCHGVYVEARKSGWGGGGWGAAIEFEGHIVKECWSRGDVASPLRSSQVHCTFEVHCTLGSFLLCSNNYTMQWKPAIEYMAGSGDPAKSGDPRYEVGATHIVPVKGCVALA